MSIGARLRQLRLDNRLTQEQVGEICDVTKSMVSQWESDESTPATDRLILLRRRIDFSIDWLLMDGPAPRPQTIALMRVAEKLPDYAVEKLTREGSSYAELIESAKSGQGSKHNNGTSG
jgi:transcriptional regulator with XRE-family HTH domain